MGVVTGKESKIGAETFGVMVDISYSKHAPSRA